MLHAKLVVTLPWFLLRAWWQRRNSKEGAEHEIVVSPGPDGRPGERLIAPSPSLWRPRVVPGGRNDFSAFLDREGSTLQGVCLGRVTERGDPEISARDTVELFWAKGWVALKPMMVERIGMRRRSAIARPFQAAASRSGSSLTTDGSTRSAP